MNRWKRVAQSLVRLADDQRGKPEGDLAREKLLQILSKYPEARQYEPVIELIEKDLTMADVAWMRHNFISTDGSWTGANLAEAVALMEADYRERIARAKRGKLQAPVFVLEGE